MASSGSKSSNVHALPTMPVMQTIPFGRATQRVFQGRRPDQVDYLVDAAARKRSDFLSDVPGIDHDFVYAVFQQKWAFGCVARGRDHVRACMLRQGCGCKADGSRPATDQQAFSVLQPERSR